MSGIGQLVTSGPLILALPVAAAAGAVTFLSPCCLPLVPGYLSFVTGMAGAARAPEAPASASGAAGASGAADPVAAASAGPASGTSAVAVAAGTSAVALAGAGTSAVAVAAPARTAAGAAAAPRSRVIAGTALFVLGFSVVFVAYGAALGGLGHLLTGHARLLTQVLGGLTILLGLLFAGAFDRFSFAGAPDPELEDRYTGKSVAAYQGAGSRSPVTYVWCGPHWVNSPA